MKSNYWFRLDCDFLSDAKIQNILFDYGPEAVLAYLVAAIRLYRNNGKCERAIYKQIAYEAHTSLEVVTNVIENSGLFFIDDTFFYSNRVLKELETQKEISAKRSEAGKRGAQQRLANAQANDKQMLGKSEANGKPITNYQLPITNTEDNIDNSLFIDIDNNTGKNKYMTIEEMVTIWNTECGNLPKARTNLSAERKKKAGLRIKEFGKTAQEQMETMRDITRRLAKSNFANGNNNQGWRADFGWIIANSENWVKVVEGRYDNNPLAGVKDIRDIKNLDEAIWNRPRE